MSERPLMAGDGLHPQRGNRLPLYCTGRKVTPKQGGLMKQFPLLAAEWDVEKNAPLTPQDVTTGSHKLIWWRCPRGHSYRSAVKTRAQGSGCPYCAGKNVLPEETSLAAEYPSIAKEWDAAKNVPLLPTQGSPAQGAKSGGAVRKAIRAARRRLSLLRQPKGAAGIQRLSDRSAAGGEAVARDPQRRTDTGDGDRGQSQKGVVAVLLRPCLESHHLLARGRAAVRLSRLRRKNESREDIKISACRKADFI